MSLVLEITTDNRGAVKGIREVGGNLEKLGKTSKKTNDGMIQSFKKNRLAIMAAVGATVLLIKKFNEAASAAIEIDNKFSVVFKGVRNVHTEIGILAKKTGFARSSLKQMTSSLGDLIKPAGFSAQAAFQMSKRITELSLDLSSFNNLKPADVVRDFQSALAGSAETLLKYGIDVKEASIAQEAFNLGLIKTVGAYNKLDPLQKREIRTQALISKAFKDSKDAIGDLQRTIGEFATQSKILEENWKKIQENIGNLLLPTIATTVKGANILIEKLMELIDISSPSQIKERLEADLKWLEEYWAAVNNPEYNKVLVNEFYTQKGILDIIKERTGEETLQSVVILELINQLKEELGLIENIAGKKKESLATDMQILEMLEYKRQLQQEMHEEAMQASRDALDAKLVAIDEENDYLAEEEEIHQKRMEMWEEEDLKIREADTIKRFSAFQTTQLEKQKSAAMKQSIMDIGSAFQNFKDQSKGAFAAYKAFAIAETVMSTYSAAQKQFEALSFFPPAAYIAAAAAIVAGMGRVAQISAESYATGGILSGGYNYKIPDSKDNVLIHAQTGEYITRKSSVNNETLPVLSQINQTGKIPVNGNTFNINISTQMVDELFVRNELVPLINRVVKNRTATMYSSELV